jgi:hypothetical protein
MVENLTKLYNTLALVETKGESTKTMAKCLQFIELLIDDQKQHAAAPVEPIVEQ